MACCNPSPEREISGYLTSRGIEVHRQDCSKVIDWKTSNHPCLVSVDWDSLPEQTYRVEIEIQANDRFGLIRGIATILSKEKNNITAIQSQTDTENMAHKPHLHRKRHFL